MSQTLRCLESTAENPTLEGREIDQMYAGALDAVVIHQAFPAQAVAHAAAFIAAEDATTDWNRPNRPIPGIDLHLLGVGAAPTATTPAGPEADVYLEAAGKTTEAIRSLFGGAFDPFAAIEKHLHQLSGRPVAVPSTADQRRFSPCTVRVIPEGAGLMVHHDNHYQLPVYQDVRRQMDTSLQLSFFVVLQQPQEGGRLCVYTRGPSDDAELPRLENDMPDPVGFDNLVPHQYFDLAQGDMIVFASGRLYHTVERVAGPLARVTIGGFMGLDAAHEQCLYWS